MKVIVYIILTHKTVHTFPFASVVHFNIIATFEEFFILLIGNLLWLSLLKIARSGGGFLIKNVLSFLQDTFKRAISVPLMGQPPPLSSFHLPLPLLILLLFF